MTMLERMRALCGVTADAPEDAKLQFALETTCDKVKNYCNIDEIPAGLETVVVEMVMQEYQTGGVGVKALTEGEDKVEFTADGAGAFLRAYTPQLNRYRRLRTVRAAGRRIGG